MAAKWPFICVAKQQIIHRKTPGSASTKVAKMERAGLLTLQKAFAATPQFDYLKNQSLARFYNYCADLYYSNHRDSKDMKKALQRLWWAIKLHPPILRERSVFKLLPKLLLGQFLSAKIIRNCYQPFKQKSKIFDPRDVSRS